MAGQLYFLLLTHSMIQILKVTNHVVGGEDGNSKPALGESWKSVPHVRLLLSRDCGGNVCNISIIKHPAMVCVWSENFFMVWYTQGVCFPYVDRLCGVVCFYFSTKFWFMDMLLPISWNCIILGVPFGHWDSNFVFLLKIWTSC